MERNARAMRRRHGRSASVVLGTLLAAVALGSSSPWAVLRASAAGGAKFDKPVAVTVTGAECESNGKGSIGAAFPSHGDSKLAFNVGPATAAPDMLHMNKAPYRGPGTYTSAMVSGYPIKGDLKSMFFGLGTIVVHPDRQTGTFASADGRASGTWDCGAPLK